jgi:hypothetical protein
MRKTGRSANDSTTPELVSKKKIRNSAKVVDDVRYDCVGHWPAHSKKKKGVNYVLQHIQG